MVVLLPLVRSDVSGALSSKQSYQVAGNGSQLTSLLCIVRQECNGSWILNCRIINGVMVSWGEILPPT